MLTQQFFLPAAEKSLVFFGRCIEIFRPITVSISISVPIAITVAVAAITGGYFRIGHGSGGGGSVAVADRDAARLERECCGGLRHDRDGEDAAGAR